MKWAEMPDLVMALADTNPNIGPRYVNFAALQPWVYELNKFADWPEPRGEKILESIQAAWIEEIAK